MILRHLIPKLENHFPGQFSVSDEVVTFPAKHPDVGSVEVHDDAEELTIYAGKFSHLHFSNCDSTLSKEQTEEQIANDALAFLLKLLSDQIVMWVLFAIAADVMNEREDQAQPFLLRAATSMFGPVQ